MTLIFWYFPTIKVFLCRLTLMTKKSYDIAVWSGENKLVLYCYNKKNTDADWKFLICQKRR